jgi:hypothetical protein
MQTSLDYDYGDSRVDDSRSRIKKDNSRSFTRSPCKYVSSRCMSAISSWSTCISIPTGITSYTVHYIQSVAQTGRNFVQTVSLRSHISIRPANAFVADSIKANNTVIPSAVPYGYYAETKTMTGISVNMACPNLVTETKRSIAHTPEQLSDTVASSLVTPI